MKTAKQILILTILLSAFCVSGVSGQESIEGDWAGGSNLFPNSYGGDDSYRPRQKMVSLYAWRNPTGELDLGINPIDFVFRAGAGSAKNQMSELNLQKFILNFLLPQEFRLLPTAS